MFLLFDIGGTKTRFGVSEDGEQVNDLTVIDTPSEFDAAMQTFPQVIEKVSNGRNVEIAAGGIAGVLDSEKKNLLKSPNLPGWENKPLYENLKKFTGTDIYFENDADLAGLGEAILGAGKGYKIVAYITVSTGIGGTRVVDGKIDNHVYGFEPGHQILDVGGSITGNVADLEELAAGSGIEKRYNASPEDIKDSAVWEQVTKYLALGVYNTILHWSPEIVVIGGGLIDSAAIKIDALNIQLTSMTNLFPNMPKIVQSQLGETSGLYGALHVLKNR